MYTVYRLASYGCEPQQKKRILRTLILVTRSSVTHHAENCSCASCVYMLVHIPRRTHHPSDLPTRARASPTINHSDDTTNDNNRKDDDYNNNSRVSSGICCDEALETHNACRPLCKWTNAGRRYYKILCYPCPNSTTASSSRSSAADVVPTAVFVIAVQSEPDARFAYFGRRSTFFTVSPSCQRILEPSLHNNVITLSNRDYTLPRASDVKLNSC